MNDQREAIQEQEEEFVAEEKPQENSVVPELGMIDEVNSKIPADVPEAKRKIVTVNRAPAQYCSLRVGIRFMLGNQVFHVYNVKKRGRYEIKFLGFTQESSVPTGEEVRKDG